MMDADVLIVGSGPAGVSAAFPLLDAGLRVLMVDGGRTPSHAAPRGPYLEQRKHDREQWRWMIGTDFYALRNAQAVSPKLRVPGHSYVFDGFAQANRIAADGFVAVGSLAAGGLSNVWGCGVARLKGDELAGFPCRADAMERSYEAVARRIGISGAGDDDLADYFGLDAWASPALTADALHESVFASYARKRAKLHPLGFRMGRPRVAVLREDRGDRLGCDHSGMCLFGCARRSLYSAAEDLAVLRRHANFSYRPGFIVSEVSSNDGASAVHGSDANGPATLRASRVLLAAGTLATTRLVLSRLPSVRSVPLQSSPTAAFLLWHPRALGRAPQDGFALGQLTFALDLSGPVRGFGSLFATGGIPVAEFLRHVPFTHRFGADILAGLLPSCSIGNLFLPGHLSRAQLALQEDGALRVSGGYANAVAPAMADAKSRLSRAFRHLGAWMLPGSFTIGAPGSDIHYAASLPMRESPHEGETGAHGEVAQLPGVHVVDGACLPSLPEKSHTLTIMANADRIAREVARQLVDRIDS